MEGACLHVLLNDALLLWLPCTDRYLCWMGALPCLGVLAVSYAESRDWQATSAFPFFSIPLQHTPFTFSLCRPAVLCHRTMAGACCAGVADHDRLG